MNVIELGLIYLSTVVVVYTHTELTPENYGAKMMINKMMLLLRNPAASLI